LRIAILSTDTVHHRYFINSIEKEGINISKYIFETTLVKSNLKNHNFFKNEENKYENENFFKSIPKNLNKKKLIKLKNINSKVSLKILEKSKFDIGIVFGCRKIKQNVIKNFKFGLINIHRGVINKYRGLESDLWALFFKDFNNIGVCLHFIDNNLDTGAIIKQKKIRIIKNMRIYQIRYLTTILATKMITNLIKKKFKDLKNARKQKKFGKYFSFMPYYKKRKAKINFDKYVKTLV
jgi:methionyl-tRNA formyltransferase